MRKYFSLPIPSPQIYHVSCFQNQNLWANSRGEMGVKTYIHVHKHIVSLSLTLLSPATFLEAYEERTVQILGSIITAKVLLFLLSL